MAFHSFIPIQSRAFGFNLWLTTLDPEDQPVTDWVETPKHWFTKYPEVNEWFESNKRTVAQQEAEKHLVESSVKRIREHPFRYLVSRIESYPHLWLHSGKLWYTNVSFSSAWGARQFGVIAIKAFTFLFLSLLPLSLGIIGIFLSRKNWRNTLPLLLVPIVIAIFHLPMWIEDRYGTPAVPFFLIFAAFALTRIGARLGAGVLEHNGSIARSFHRDSSQGIGLASVSVIIPAKNEGSVVVQTARGAKDYCDEVIIVDGNSTDGSVETLREGGFTIVADNGRGKGDAVRCGLSAATCDIAVMMDADGSHDPEDIPKLVAPIIRGEADMVIGCRMRGGSDEFAGTWELFIRLWGNNFLTMLLNTRYGCALTDTQNGFRAARLPVLRELQLRENKHTIELEMVMKTLKRRYKVIQVPSHEYCRKEGVSSLSIRKQGFHFLRCLLRNVW